MQNLGAWRADRSSYFSRLLCEETTSAQILKVELKRSNLTLKQMTLFTKDFCFFSTRNSNSLFPFVF